jgi:hypothetical protein
MWNLKAVHAPTPCPWLFLALILLIVWPASLTAQAASAPAQDERFVVEYYYKVRWGYQQEFIELYRKNHFPVLSKEMEKGRILQISAVSPRYHGTEDGRWDYRVTIVYRNAAAAVAPTPVTEEEMRQLFPDRATFEKEEQRRFEILEAHWDLPLVTVSVSRS